MDYYAHNRNQDEIIQIPIDRYVFKDIEETWPHFKEEPHNLKFLLVADNVNPF